MTRLGVVSDTHGQAAFAREAAHLLQSFDVQTVLHCGDIGSVEIVRVFSQWPTHFVLGNVDEPAAPLRAAIEAAGQHFHARFGQLELAGRKIAFLHGDDTLLLQETINGGRYDLVCFGHTHRAEQRQVGPTLALNPGALYRANPHTLAIVELPELTVQTLRV